MFETPGQESDEPAAMVPVFVTVKVFGLSQLMSTVPVKLSAEAMVGIASAAAQVSTATNSK